MELDTLNKQLHRRAAPVIIVTLSLLVLSGAYARYSLTSPAPANRLGRALFTPVLSVKPAANGLASVATKQPQPPAGQAMDGSALSQAGQSANLSFSFGN